MLPDMTFHKSYRLESDKQSIHLTYEIDIHVVNYSWRVVYDIQYLFYVNVIL